MPTAELGWNKKKREQQKDRWARSVSLRLIKLRRDRFRNGRSLLRMMGLKVAPSAERFIDKPGKFIFWALGKLAESIAVKIADAQPL